MHSTKNKKIFYASRNIAWSDPADFFNALPAAACSFFIDNAGEGSGGTVSYVSVGEPLEKIIIPAAADSSGGLFFKYLDKLKNIVPSSGSPFPFSGGMAGYLSYEGLVFFEDIKLRAKPAASAPLAALMAPRAFAAFDASSRRASLFCAGATPAAALKNLAKIKLPDFRESGTLLNAPADPAAALSDFTPTSFALAARAVKNYISAGDIFQANIARRWRMSLPPSSDGRAMFLYLRRINPSPCACYIKFGPTEIISCSPELLVRVRGRIVETRPIAGTRPRGSTPANDRRLSVALLGSPKERAEHIMLVDLERNDLGRVCLPSTICVDEKMSLERYSHVTHIVSNVRGRLKKNISRRDILRAMFPGGTITGCPKIRSIQIIDEVEPVARGPYCGSAGWFSPTGDMELNILIRTIIKTPRLAEFYAGAGIVADSNPLREYRETSHKARALASALGIKV